MVHNTAQNSSDNLPSYPPDNHHSLDAVSWRRRNYSIESTVKNICGKELGTNAVRTCGAEIK